MTTASIKLISRGNTSLRDADFNRAPQSPAATSTILPGPNPGERLASYFEKFFATVIGISTLGANITFSKMISTPVTPWINYGYDVFTIQTLLATAWLIFVITLILASLFASLLSLYRPQAVEAFSTKNHHNKRKTMWAATGVSMLLFGSVAASFMFLSLVTAAYVGPVGWAALCFTAGLGLVGMGGIVWQSPISWPSRMIKLRSGSEKDETSADQLRYSDQNRPTFDSKAHGSSWPIYGKGQPRANILPHSTGQANLGSNLTGGTLLSSLRRKPIYTDLPQEKSQDTSVEPSRMEESFSTEKEWEAYRSAGGHPMRLQPRVSWPRAGVVSSQFSPPPPPPSHTSVQQTQQRYQPPPPQLSQSAPSTSRRGQREYKHDRRERLQTQLQQQQQQHQQQQQQQQQPAQQVPSQIRRTQQDPYIAHRTSLPPRYQEQEDVNSDKSSEGEEEEEDDEEEEEEAQEIYPAEQTPSETESFTQSDQLQCGEEQHEQGHPMLHHRDQSVYRTIPQTRRSGGGSGSGQRPVWEGERGS